MEHSIITVHFEVNAIIAAEKFIRSEHDVGFAVVVDKLHGGFGSGLGVFIAS